MEFFNSKETYMEIALQDMSVFDSLSPISPELTKDMMKHVGKGIGSIPNSARS